MNSLVRLEIAHMLEGLATAVNVACIVGGWVGCPLVILDHRSVGGNLTKLAAIMATGKLTFPMVAVHVNVQ